MFRRCCESPPHRLLNTPNRARERNVATPNAGRFVYCTRYHKGIKGIPGQRVTYVVNATREEVFAFYDDVLVKEGWEVIGYTIVADGVPYTWRGCPVFGLDVAARDRGDASVEVELNITKEVCL